MAKSRRCQVGKPCGASCITRLKICRKDLISALSDEMGKVRDVIPSRSESNVSRSVPEEAKEQYQKDFAEHVLKNSAGYSNATFQPGDLLNLVLQASNDLEGEAKENLKKLMEFAVKDNQVLFVSTKDVPRDNRDVKTVRKFAELLDKSYPYLKLNFERNINFIRELKAERKEKVLADRKRKAEGLPPISRERIERIDRDIKNLSKQLKEARDKIFADNVTRSSKDSNWGFTSAQSRRVVVMDKSSTSSEKFVRGERVDVKLIARQIQETIDFRAKTPKLTDEEIFNTRFAVGRFAEGKTTNAYLHVYLHELGHQVQHRANSNVPPADSVSLKRGSTIYNTNTGISHYSRFNNHEAFAEAFATFILNPKALREHDEPLYNWVSSSLDKAMARAGAPV